MSNNKNILMVLRFDGSNYAGWQIQKNAISIQEVFQKSLKKIIKDDIKLKGCSRTDSGVHANNYCLNVWMNLSVPINKLATIINLYLPSDIVVINCIEVENNFHARYFCKAKEYIYKVYTNKIRDPFLYKRVFHYPYEINKNFLESAAIFFEGKHDFTSFCNKNLNFLKQKKINYVRNVFYFKIEKKNNIIEFRIKADGFLYNMVRIIVGTLLMLWEKKIPASQIIKIIESKNRKNSGSTVPAHGLYLNKIFYEGMEM